MNDTVCVPAVIPKCPKVALIRVAIAAFLVYFYSYHCAIIEVIINGSLKSKVSSAFAVHNLAVQV